MAKMTREQIMERQPICDGLMELYQRATKHKIEIFYNAFVVYVGDSYDEAKRFTRGEDLMDFILTELRGYLLGGDDNEA